MENPWSKIPLDDYESHMSLTSIQQLQALNKLMEGQIMTWPVSSAMILGVAGGNGLEHIRSCSVSIQEQTDKSERKHLKRVLQFALAVFPKSATFIDPSKGTLNDPAFRKDSKCVEFIALHNLNICARKSVDGVGKIFSGIASIHQNLLEHRQVIGYITIVVNHINCSVPVGHIGSCYHDHVGQP